MVLLKIIIDFNEGSSSSIPASVLQDVFGSVFNRSKCLRTHTSITESGTCNLSRLLLRGLDFSGQKYTNGIGIARKRTLLKTKRNRRR